MAVTPAADGWREFVRYRFEEQQRHLDELDKRTEQVPVLAERVANALDAMKQIRNALYATGGGLALMAVAIVLKAG